MTHSEARARRGVTRHITSIYPSTRRQHPRLPVVLVDPLTLCANDNATNGRRLCPRRSDVEIASTILIRPIISQGTVFRANTRLAVIPRIVSGYNGRLSLSAHTAPLSLFVPLPLCHAVRLRRAGPRVGVGGGGGMPVRGGVEAHVITVCPRHFNV